ncbi:MAG: hydroxymethylbilane synthase [Chloroflexi bacterium]|nr:hydroxymethylbilane synthase [Chloroflexota bacterium]MDA1296533.1 hydroxymethylbilane synthase [Chloroflexota bacterium]
MSKIIRVGTRGSDLALAQAGLVIASLRKANPDTRFEAAVITTRGDRDQSTPIANVGYGVFVSELENALTRGEIDIAVHSLKDMPSTLGPEFEIAAVPYREDPRDVVVSRDGSGLMDMPRGARVGTGSARRKALLLDRRPDLIVEPVRGNVPTRLAKLDAADGPEAVVLAAAGLIRLDLKHRITEYLKCWDFVAAVGQGALAIEVRAKDEEVARLVRPLQHEETRVAVDAERAFLAAVEGGCSAPVSAHAQVRDGGISMHAFAAAPDGSRVIRGKREGAAGDSVKLALELADELLKAGAGELLSPETGSAG